MTTNPQKITFGEMRASGVRGLLICCKDHRCSHSVTMSADGWPDDARLSDLESTGGSCLEVQVDGRPQAWGSRHSRVNEAV